jgi:hypothetical protein
MQDIEYGQFCDLDPYNAIHVPMNTKRSIIKINVSECMQKPFKQSKIPKKSNTSLSSLQSHEMYVRSLPSTDFTKYMIFQDKYTESNLQTYYDSETSKKISTIISKIGSIFYQIHTKKLYKSSDSDWSQPLYTDDIDNKKHENQITAIKVRPNKRRIYHICLVIAIALSMFIMIHVIV